MHLLAGFYGLSHCPPARQSCVVLLSYYGRADPIRYRLGMANASLSRLEEAFAFAAPRSISGQGASFRIWFLYVVAVKTGSRVRDVHQNVQ